MKSISDWLLNYFEVNNCFTLKIFAKELINKHNIFSDIGMQDKSNLSMLISDSRTITSIGTM